MKNKDKYAMYICLAGVVIFAILGFNGFFEPTEETPQAQPQETIDEPIAVEEQKPELPQEDEDFGYIGNIQIIGSDLSGYVLNLNYLFKLSRIEQTFTSGTQENQQALENIEKIKGAKQRIDELEVDPQLMQKHQSILSAYDKYLQGCTILEQALNKKDTPTTLDAFDLFKEANSEWQNIASSLYDVVY